MFSYTVINWFTLPLIGHALPSRAQFAFTFQRQNAKKEMQENITKAQPNKTKVNGTKQIHKHNNNLLLKHILPLLGI